MKARGERVKRRRVVAVVSGVEGEGVSCTVSERRAHPAEGIARAETLEWDFVCVQGTGKTRRSRTFIHKRDACRHSTSIF